MQRRHGVMDGVLTDVSAASVELARLLGPDREVDPNKIFARVEAMEASGDRVARVVEQLGREEEDSLPTTPSDSVISINDDDSKDEMIDLTNYDELGKQVEEELLLAEQGQEEQVDEEEDSMEARLRADTGRVLRILQDESGPAQEWEEVYAYLEAHLLKPNRVQIVVEEFLGMAESRREEQESPRAREESPEPQALAKGKGKGKGKRVGARAISPEAAPLVEEVREAVKREHSPEEEVGKKQKTVAERQVEVEESQVDVEESQVKVEERQVKVEERQVRAKEKRRHRRQARQSPLTDDMMHGPFDFSSHRAPAPRPAPRPHNLPAGLQELVEGGARAGRRTFALTPSRLGEVARETSPTRTSPSTPTRHPSTPTRLNTPISIESTPSTPTRNYVQPGRLGGAPTTPTRLATPAPVVLREARLLLPASPVIRKRARAPSVEVVGEEVGVGPVVVEVEDREEEGRSRAEVEELAGHLSMMFPDTPPEYILARCADLAGRPIATERFAEELLAAPAPPPDWRAMYSRPWSPQVHGGGQGGQGGQGLGGGQGGHGAEEVVQIVQEQAEPVVQEQVVPMVHGEEVVHMDQPLPEEPDQPAALLPDQPAALVPDQPAALVPDQPATLLPEPAGEPGGRAQPPLAPGAAALQEEVEADSAAPSTSSNAEPEGDPVHRWTLEKQDFMVSMFPDICPDWLLVQVQACLPPPAPAPEAMEGEGVLGELGEAAKPPADVAAMDGRFQNKMEEAVAGEQGDAARPTTDIAAMDVRFQTKVEEIFLLPLEERAKLPTRLGWEAACRQRAELEKWSGAMSVADMLALYQDDPAGHFANPDRRPESEGYKQHAMAALKDLFRHHSITEIEKSFKKAKFLFTPTFRHLKHLMETGKKTRKTQRPDFEIKFPSSPCIELLKEKKFCELEEEIAAESGRRSAAREAAVEGARAAGLLEECKCCYSPDCLREDMVECKGGHCYCRCWAGHAPGGRGRGRGGGRGRAVLVLWSSMVSVVRPPQGVRGEGRQRGDRRREDHHRVPRPLQVGLVGSEPSTLLCFAVFG